LGSEQKRRFRSAWLRQKSVDVETDLELAFRALAPSQRSSSLLNENRAFWETGPVLKNWSLSRAFIACFFVALIACAILGYLAFHDFSNTVNQLNPHPGHD
jgi:hypothetical protein